MAEQKNADARRAERELLAKLVNAHCDLIIANLRLAARILGGGK